MLRKFYALVTALTLLTTLSAAQVVNVPILSLVSAIGQGSGPQQPAIQGINISDHNLASAIRQELGLQPDAMITRWDMMKLTRLSYHDSNLSNLSGMEHAVNLEYLYLTRHQISDISPLSGLTKLRTLMLHTNPIQDISPVANLTELTYFGIIGCEVRDISAMSGLVLLEEFQAQYGKIEDITPLANLTNLVVVHLHYNRIVDISPLSNLVNLKELIINNNQIIDFSPIDGLSIANLVYDQTCDISRLSIQERLDGRNMPSIFLPWDDGILNRGGIWWDPSIPRIDRITPHDLWWHGPGHKFGIEFKLFPDGYRLAGNLPEAIERREEMLSKNPNMLFLADMRHVYSPIDRFPEDWFGWLRDDNGNRIFAFANHALVNFHLPEVQDVIVQRCSAVADCGLYDGVMFDAWGIDRSKPEEDWYALVRRIREAVPDDFLILFNTNHWYVPHLAPYINGSFMETFPHVREDGYTRDRIIEIETNLILWENNARDPQINCLRGFGIGSEPLDSPNNLRWMRLFTTMSLTCSDGYSVYTLGDRDGQKHYQKHIWYEFWSADLGQPVSDKTVPYQDIEGLYIREFTNGWAVYNRSGKAHIIELPEEVQSMQSGLENDSHAVLDLDGDIFLRIKAVNRADVNGDGVTNVFDLVIVAEAMQ